MLKRLAFNLSLVLFAVLGGCSTGTEPAQVADADPHASIATLASGAAGEPIYQRLCASCHDNPEASKAPSREALTRVSAQNIINTLIMGRMSAQAASLNSKEIQDVANYLSAGEDTAGQWIAPHLCAANRRTPKFEKAALVQGFGFTYDNKRELSYAQTGLKKEDFANLDVAWVMAFPQVASMRGQAAVVGETLFLPVSDNNRVFAINIGGDKPCVQWVYDAGRAVRTSAGYGKMSDGTPIIMVGDMAAFIHVINAKTGKKMWETHVGFIESQMVTSTPVLYKDRVYAPVSQYELSSAATNAYLCCKARGGVTALDARTGKKIWATPVMPEAKPLVDRGDGQMHWGPSGGAIWNSLSLDVKRNRLYVGTGEANSAPAHANTDALLAFDLDSGKIVWSHQATADDVYNGGCFPGREAHLNCPKPTVYRDVDFGASTILAKAPNGRDLVLGGQKSGSVWAMNPDNGEVVWRQALGHGTAMGGIHWGIAADDKYVYAPISNAGRPVPTDPAYNAEQIKPGIYALNLNDGSIAWQHHVAANCGDDERKKFVPRCQNLFGLSGAPTVIGDYVVIGGLDGWLYILDKHTGKEVSKINTARTYETVNGVAGNGGSIDNASIIATHGMLIMNSGYGMFGQASGNVMIAFKPRT